MNLFNAIGVGLKEIWAHKFRSALTMLGIILGVSSLVAMSSMVAGMEKGATEGLVAMGALNKFRIETEDLPDYQSHLQDQARGLTLNDIEALRAGAPLLKDLAPEIRLRGITLSRHGEHYRPWRLSGAWPISMELSEHVIEHGRTLSALDEAEARSVCVIGTRTRDELFGDPDEIGEEIIPVGEVIYFSGQPFTIVGMFQRYESEEDRKRRETQSAQTMAGPSRSRGRNRSGPSSWVFAYKNSQVFIPLNTARLKFMAGRDDLNPDALSLIEVKIDNYENLGAALQQARNVLLNTHKGLEDFEFRTSEEWADEVALFVRNARISGGMISGVSLLVGGIGIMNIMLSSIASRIREIGIRKAVGAATEAIFLQILIESVVLAILGGLVGLVSSYGLVQAIGSFSPTGNEPLISVPVLAFAFGCCVAIGIAAGLFPAIKAARMDPIVALRYE